MNALAPVRWSSLKWMALSPCHYRYFLGQAVTETPAMRMGSRVDSNVFGTRREDFAIFDGDRRGKEWSAFKEQNAGRTILTRDEDDTSLAIAAAVNANEHARDRLELTNRQRRCEWHIAGRECAGTPDANDMLRVSELKVSASANPDRFMWHALKQGWLGQLAWYAHGLDIEHPELSIVAVEPKPPHVVTVFTLTDNAIQLGRQQWRLYFERLRACEEADHWPGYCESPVPLDAPDKVTVTVDGEEVDL